jgi:hypothetical protein
MAGSRVRCRQLDQLLRMGVRQGACHDHDGVDALSRHPREGALELVGASHVDASQRDAQGPGRAFELPDAEHIGGVHRIKDHPHAGDRAGSDLSQKFQPFWAQLGVLG